MTGPLTGIRVLDLSWIIAGPLAGRLLSDFGAEVIKIESALRMDIGRANRTPLYGVLPDDANTNPDTGGYFQDANGGKLSCTLNLATPGGRELLRRLVAVSDVTICNLGGDQYDRWGIGYEVARELNPGLIMVNMPSMDSSPERARWRAFGYTFVAAAGLNSISGHPADPPLSWGHAYADFTSNPFHATVAIMAALFHRDRTGEGQFIEVSQYESTVGLVGPAILEYSQTGVPPGPAGNTDAIAIPHNFYRCAGEDSWCAIAVENEGQWEALVSVMGLWDLRRPELATSAGRRRCEREIDQAIEEWTRARDRQEVANLLQGHGVPAGPFQKIDEIVHHDPTLSSRHFAELQHPIGRRFLVHRNPIESRTYPPEARLAPLLGEHSFEVLTRILGLTEDEVADFAAQGALE